MPDAPPVPIAQTYDSGAGTGSVTFDKPLDTGVVLNPGDWKRGTGSGYRPVTALSYASPTQISIDGLDPIVFGGIPAGWKYTKGAAPLVGVNGVEVDSFVGFNA